MSFAFFIVLNGILLIRPEDILPQIAGLRLYFIVIGLCALTTFPQIIDQFSPDRLAKRPITICALGLLVALLLSQIVRGHFEVFDTWAPEFAKVLLYFLLLMAVVNTPERLLTFAGWIVVFVVVLAALGLLQFFEYIDVENLRPCEQREYDETSGEVIMYPRLCSAGIYSDPNDMCLILVTASICCLCRFSFAASILIRIIWVLPLCLFIYSITLTKSRGGFLGLLVSGLTLLYARYGAKKCLPLAAIFLPLVLVLFGGRQTNFNTGGDDTAQERMRLWAEGLALLMNRNPVTGIGVGQYAEELGLVAHNSFVHAYVETGLFGGTLFLSAFYLSIYGLWRIRRDRALVHQPRLRRIHPFVFAMVIGYAAGCYSVSRNFVIPTYMVLGIAAAFISMSYPITPAWCQFNEAMAKRLVIVGIVGLVFLKLFTQMMVRYGT